MFFCECGGHGHKAECYLGKRLKIKYSKVIQEIWSIVGGEKAENLIDEIMELLK